MSSKIKLRFGNVMNWIGKRQLMSLRIFRHALQLNCENFGGENIK